MSSFPQWQKSQADKGVLKRVSWICGPERVLVEEVVNYIRAASTDIVSMVAGEDKDRDIWSALNQYSSEDGNRLIQVREAERIQIWQPLVDWLANSRLMPNSYLALISTEHTLDSEHPIYRTLQDKSMTMVRCNHLAEEDAVQWLQSRTEVSADVAHHALARTAGDLARADGALWKAKLLTPEPSRELIDALAQQMASDQFADSLLFNRRTEALAALALMEPDEYSAAIGMLDSRLDTVSVLNRAAKRGLTPREIIMQKMANAYLVQKFYGAAKIYDMATVERRRQLLLLADGYLRDGAREAVMEGIVSLW